MFEFEIQKVEFSGGTPCRHRLTLDSELSTLD
jgi:hypothetical protein